jgi:hypothetical protein
MLGLDANTYTANSEFEYGPIFTTIIDNGSGEPGDDIIGDAIVRVEFDPETESFDLVLTGDNGDVFTKHIDLTPADIDRGYVDITIPAASDGLKNGTYQLIATAYDSAGDMIYQPYTQSVNVDILLPPKTGVLALTDALSRDYTAIAILVVSVIVVFSVIVIKRHRAQER